MAARWARASWSGVLTTHAIEQNMRAHLDRSRLPTLLVLLTLLPGELRAQVRISEIHYHPTDPALEFLEIVNTGPGARDLSGWAFLDGVSFVFPEGTTLSSRGRLLVSRDRSALVAATGVDPSRVLGDWSGLLENEGERIALVDPGGMDQDVVVYGDAVPFDPRAAGAGPSLERVCLDGFGDDPGNWIASAVANGTPLSPRPDGELCPPPAPRAHGSVIITEIHYHPVGDAPLEFIELHNRTDAAIDLELWSLEDGIEFTFDSAREVAVLPPRGYRLIAADPDALAAATGRDRGTIAGPFLGKLSNFADEIDLRDPAGRLVDRVRYAQDGIWPAAADGLGPSLQRISTEVVGTTARNWKAGSAVACRLGGECVLLENGADLHWLEILDGLDPGFSGDVSWFDPDFDATANGFRAGRLAVGFDSRAPDGQPWVLTPSSSIDGLHSILLRMEFEWRPGDCGAALPFLAVDRDDGFVAWLNGVEIARGGMLDPAGTVPAFDGSYRAEIVTAGGFRGAVPIHELVWRGSTDSLRPGRNVLAIGNYNSRATSSDLYLSARLTLGEPAIGGEVTPGEPNGFANADVPPLASSVEHTPSWPGPEEPVRIEAAVEGARPGSVVTLEWIADAGVSSGEMRDDGLAPDRVAGDKLFTAEIPPAANLTLVRYRVIASGADGCSSRFPREGNPSEWTGYLVSDAHPEVSEDVRVYYIFTPGALADLSCASGARRDGDLVDFRGRARFGVGVKFRGETACNYPKRPIRVEFQKGDLLDGQSNLNFNAGWNDKAMAREKLGFDFFRDAGVPYSETHFARVHTNGGRFHGAYFTVEDPDDSYLRRNEWDDDAGLYKSRTAMLNASTSGFEPRSSSAAERLPRVGNFAARMNSTNGSQLIDLLVAELDVESFIDYQAVQSIIIDGDSVVKNWLLYHGRHGRARTGGDRFTAFAWDIDLSHGQMLLTTDVRHHNIHPLFQTQQYPFHDQGYHGIINALLQRSPDDYFVKAFYGRIWSLLEEKFRPEVFLARVDAYDEATIASAREDLARWPRNWGARGNDPDFWRDDLRAWAERRHDWLRAYLLADNPTTSGRRFQYTPAPRVRFSEIHYHPRFREELEFLELRNLESTPVDVGGWSIPAVEWVFAPGTTIPANGFLVLARDPSLLSTANPDLPRDVAIVGPYGGALENSGEELRLLDSGVYRGRDYHPETIDRVDYDDLAPWPTEADGAGPSLELRDATLDNDLAASWRSSRRAGGSPGRAEAANQAPELVVMISPRRGVAPLLVRFDASGSTDADGDVLTASWDFGNGTTGEGLSGMIVYRSAGTYQGSVTLTDGFNDPVISAFVIDVIDAPRFRRGDVAGDGTLDITDAIRLLGALFLGGEIDCVDAGDVDDDGQVLITDAIRILDHLFLTGAPPSPPYPDCGADPRDDALGCDATPGC